MRQTSPSASTDNTAAPSDATPSFDAVFRTQLLALLRWRRDVRHFRTTPLPPGLLDQLLETAQLAPSVGLSEPWRFVVVDDARRRDAIQSCFARCNAAALAAQDATRAGLYARLKLAGLGEAPSHIAVFADPATTQGHGLGRQTMPSTLEMSAAMAVHTLWLAARAAGVGLGWVSILDAAEVTAILDVPSGWSFIGYLCLGYPRAEDDTPELERVGWAERRPSGTAILRR